MGVSTTRPPAGNPHRDTQPPMPRHFNTTGPCDPADHYMLAPERRLPDLLPFVEQKLYFVIHAARQTGKTTAMRAFATRLRGLGYAAVHATLEECQGMEALDDAEPIWLAAIEDAAAAQLPAAHHPPGRAVYLDREPGTRLRQWLGAWSHQQAPRRVVLLLDEADIVSGPALISLLRQLRAGFLDRPERFPASVALIGMQELRDYLAHAKDGSPVNPGSPFNIKAESLTLRNFTEEEVGELYTQHTDDTGQAFEPAAVARAFYWTQGQPFLVNALARRAVTDLVTDRRVPITAACIDEAKEALIRSRTTHLYSLTERLREPRVARIVQAVLTGDLQIPYDHEDWQYVVDLGLLREGRDGAEAANPLYREVLARQLTYNLQKNLPEPRYRWLTPEGRLDFLALVTTFLLWWRENGDVLPDDVPLYPEAVPHLSFMAYLQKVVNGGGQVHREYAANRRALDLLVVYGPDRFVVEVKRVRDRDTLETVRQAAIVQTLAYLDELGEHEGWILIFDQRKKRTWKQRLWTETVERDGHLLHLFGG